MKILKLDSAFCLSLRARRMSHTGYVTLCLQLATVTTLYITIYKTVGALALSGLSFKVLRKEDRPPYLLSVDTSYFPIPESVSLET